MSLADMKCKKQSVMMFNENKYDTNTIKNIKRGSQKWVDFIQWQKSRILERLERYNNKNTVKEQLAETGNVSPYQNYKIRTVSNFLNEALENIESGKYGICKYCKQEIPVQRLFLVPGALQCLSCDKIHISKQPG